MGLFSKKPADGATASTPAPDAPRTPAFGQSVNDRARRKQQLMLGAGAAILLGAGAWWIMPSDAETKTNDPSRPVDVKIETGDMTARNLNRQEWIATSENRLDQQGQQLKTQGTTVDQLKQQVEALRQANAAQTADGQRAIDILTRRNAELEARGAQAATAPKNEPFRVAGSTPASGPAPAAYGPGGGYDGQGRPGAPGMPGGQPGFMPVSEVKIINFGGPARAASSEGAADTGDGARLARPDAPATVVEDSPEYLPPNSYAPARVIVGVDASAGVQSQTDPLPVVLRITGPARSVVNRGRVLTTRLEGCVVNGAARGDLSSEKVYVKLAKMTCDQPGGRVAVSEVKGFISFAGKAGVRGKVVSREGNLVSQAFLAGIAGGIGRAFTLNTQAALSGGQTIINGQRQQLGVGDIAEASLGSGVSKGGDLVSKYLIERAEQYQPVIEMPTGVDVEIVFLDGVYVRGGRQ